ncbi:MAG: V-type ATP synthase subunit I [Cytophagales bacterium]|nr:V-type ATP synthase subunit I [Cytophagales bacterium]
MKARMKKIQLLLHRGEKQKFLQDLQLMGIVHFETYEQRLTSKIEELVSDREKLLKAKSLLPAGKNTILDAQYTQDALELADKILDLDHERDQNNNALEALGKELDILSPWGEFEGNYIEKLSEHGIHATFFVASKKAFQKFDFGKQAITVISEQRGIVHFVAFHDRDADLPFNKVSLPKKPWKQLAEEKARLEERKAEIGNTLGSLSSLEPLLQQALMKLNDEIIFHQTSSSFKKSGENTIHYIQGWIPENRLEDITEFLDKKSIAYILSEPAGNDDVPIILKNRRYPKIFESITNIFELPNYRELDLTPVIAVFYPIFFAYCLGDSGYGLIFVLLFGVGYFTFLRNNKVIAALGIMLGLFTMVIGIIKSGTMLGIPITTQRDIPFFDFFSRFVFIPETGDSPFNAFNVALILGIVQIIVGVVAATLRAWIYESFEASLSSIGKLFIIVSTVVLFLGSAQEVDIFLPYQDVAKYGLIAGVALVLLFNNIHLPIFKRIGTGVLPLYFIFTGLLGDTLSYIRLFALGISSGILGLVINNIGNQIMGGGIIGFIIGVIFLILGHGLNLFISGLGSFVHPLRLTFVEFYNNAGFKGGGISYKPFKKESLSIKQES